MVASTGDLDIRLLGPIEVRVDGRSIPLGGQRPAALIALLATRLGQSISVERLLDEAWAGDPPDGAVSTLKSYVSRLRPVLGHAAEIRGTRDGYALRADPEAIDARRFEAKLAAARTAADARRWPAAARALEHALGEWRGRPFGHLADLPALRAEADRFAELRIDARELLAEAQLATGRQPAELAEELEPLVAEHPYRERLWRLLMLALYHAERQADALATYHRARQALDDELGIEPGPELQALQAAILRHEIPALTTTHAAGNLPVPLTSFVGRQAELAEVAELLTTSRLVTITGVGGAGKTRLAIEAARRAADDYPDGIAFVDLAPLADPALVVTRIGAVLDIREQPGVRLIDRLGAQLRDRELLLVLDNCEHLRDACAEIAQALLPVAAGLRILATSREVLDVPGERIFGAPPLQDDDAVHLFLARAREVRPSIPDDGATVAIVGRICTDLDGLPLGIELAAARARALSPADIAARLADRFQFLVSWRRVTPARHRTLREAIDWSYELLDPGAARLLADLSVFAGGCTLAAAAAVGTDGDEAAALRRLERLVDASLVIVDTTAVTTRYRLLETIRQYAAERLAATGQADDARRRHADHFTAFALAAAMPIRGGDDQATWVARATEDLENIRATLAWSRDVGDHDRILRIADALWWFWWMRGEIREARAWMELALERAVDSPTQLRAQVLRGLAGLAWAQGDHEAAQRHGLAALELFVQLGHRHNEARSHNVLGLTAHLRGDLPAAQVHFEAALEAYQLADVTPAERALSMATTIDNLGSIAHERGDEELAVRWYEEARELNRTWGDETVMNDLHLAHIAAERGDGETARPLIAGALRWYSERSFVQYIAECFEAASIVANGAGSGADAAYFLGASGAMREHAGAPPVTFLLRLRDRELAAARATLGDEAVDAAYAQGAAAPSTAAVARALGFLEGR